MPKLTSDEVNFLVWQYLQEEGLTRTAFMLKTEAPNLNTNEPHKTASGELIRLLLRGSVLDSIESQAVAGNGLPDPHLADDAVKTENEVLEPINDPVGSPEDEKMDVVDSQPIASGLELVSTSVVGGISAVYTSKWLVVAGPHDVMAYNADDLSDSAKRSIECNETPTFVLPEPSGVLVGYLTGAVRQWRLDTTPFLLQSVLAPETDSPLSPVSKVSLSPSDERAVVLHLDNQIRVWNLVDRQLILTCNSVSAEHPQPLEQVSDIAWVNGDKAFAVAHSQGVAVFTLDAPTPLIHFNLETQSPEKAVALLAYNEVLQLLAGGSDDGHVWVWRTSEVSPVREIKVGSLPTPVSAVYWMGINLIAGTTDGNLQLFDVRSEVEDKKARSKSAIMLKNHIFDVDVSLISGSGAGWLATVTTSNGIECFKIQNDCFISLGSFVLSNVECVVSNERRIAVVTREHTYIVGN